MLRPLITLGAGLRVARYLAGAAIGRGRLDMLLDSAPLAGTLKDLIDFDRLSANVAVNFLTDIVYSVVNPRIRQ